MPARCNHTKCGTFVKKGELYCKAHKLENEPVESPSVVSRPELNGSIFGKLINLTKSLLGRGK